MASTDIKDLYRGLCLGAAKDIVATADCGQITIIESYNS